MSREEVNCKGKDCEHYRVYYGVQRSPGGSLDRDSVSGGYIPDFNIVVQKCAHPSVYKGLGMSTDTGIELTSLRNGCPKEDKESKV